MGYESIRVPIVEETFSASLGGRIRPRLIEKLSRSQRDTIGGYIFVIFGGKLDDYLRGE